MEFITEEKIETLLMQFAQELLELMIKIKSADNTWKKDLYDAAKQKSKEDSRYARIMMVFQKKELSDVAIADFDITSLYCLYETFGCWLYQYSNYMQIIKGARNEKSHRTGNETSEKIIVSSFGKLYIISQMIDVFRYDLERKEEFYLLHEDALEFCNKYEKIVSELGKEILDEVEVYQRNKSWVNIKIDEILKAPDPEEKALDILRSFKGYYMQDEVYVELIKKMGENGITCAYKRLEEYYYIQENIKEAAKWYQKRIGVWDYFTGDKERLREASYEINGLMERKSAKYDTVRKYVQGLQDGLLNDDTGKGVPVSGIKRIIVDNYLLFELDGVAAKETDDYSCTCNKCGKRIYRFEQGECTRCFAEKHGVKLIDN